MTATVQHPTTCHVCNVAVFHNQTINFRLDWRRRKNTSIKPFRLV